MTTPDNQLKPKPSKLERFLRNIFLTAFCWPLEALSAMWGLDLLEHEGFKVPTPGYLSCFVVSMGLGFLWGATTLQADVRKGIEAGEVS